MANVTRRLFLQGAGTFVWATTGVVSYAVAFEPALRLNITSYHLCPPRWPEGLTLKAAVLADVHACEPWMPASRVRGIASLTNDLKPDIVFLLGDFAGGHRFVTGPVMPEEWGMISSSRNFQMGKMLVGPSSATAGGEASSLSFTGNRPLNSVVMRGLFSIAPRPAVTRSELISFFEANIRANAELL